jgi:hypothetical protein
MDPHSFSKLDPEPDPYSLKKLDPDPELDLLKVNADPKHCPCTVLHKTKTNVSSVANLSFRGAFSLHI